MIQLVKLNFPLFLLANVFWLQIMDSFNIAAINIWYGAKSEGNYT